MPLKQKRRCLPLPPAFLPKPEDQDTWKMMEMWCFAYRAESREEKMNKRTEVEMAALLLASEHPALTALIMVATACPHWH